MKRVRKQLYVVFIVLIAASLVLSACGGSKEEDQPSADTRVAFIYQEKIDEYNWSHIHEVGRQYLLEQLPELDTKFVEEVSIDQAEQVLRDLADEGYKLIFATSRDFSDAVKAVAADYPETFFEVCQGEETAANVATYDGRMYQAFYLSGVYTGELTITGIIGFIAPEPTVEVIRHINALTLSSRIVRKFEDITVHVKWTGSWNDPEADRQAAIDLVESGADVLVQHTYSPEVQKVAEEYGVRSFGYGFDMREFAPEMNATGVVYSWGWYYLQRVNTIADGTWKGEAYNGEAAYPNFGEGIIDMAPYTYEQIPQIMEAVAMKFRARFVETNRDVFEGPINAQNGVEILARGDTFDEEYIYNEMDWFVEGVVGEAPGEPPPPASE
jgi:basic membrane protein A